MANQYGFNTSSNIYTGLQNACYNDLGHQMSVMGDEIFELPSFSPYTSTETHCYSTSSEQCNMQDFCQLDDQLSSNSSFLIVPAPTTHNSSSHSAFREYIKADPKATSDFFTPGQILHKRCFRYLSQIEENKKNPLPMSSLRDSRARAPNDNQCEKSNTDSHGSSHFLRMMAERNRRLRLKQLFTNLYSLVPAGRSKPNRYSILANTEKYLRDLKLRVAQLENQIKTLEGSSGFDSHQQPFNSKNTVLHNSDGIILEECKDIPGQVKMRISVEKDVVSCPVALIRRVLDHLRAEQLELVSIHSHTEASLFLTKIVVQSEGHQWDTRKWQYFGHVMRLCVIKICDGEV
ncbi:hypothetical protein SUGI_0801910 [Cryptomeria japonica]|nr:hypothetical protein SUGI_0801910 [Cryptomeria japonica]